MDVLLRMTAGRLARPNGERSPARTVFLRWLAIAAVIASGFSPASALAYSSPATFPDGSRAGGGGGRWFTGSPAEGYDCSVCHSESPARPSYPFYVDGLTTPYTPEQTYPVLLWWPEFAARWVALQTAVAGLDPALAPPPPAMGLVGEFVAESGRASGVVEFDVANAPADEFCERTRPNLNPRYGAQLFQVRPGLSPLELKPDADGILRCEAKQLGQRCIVAMRSCGAQALRFRWTAPEAGEGPVWFSAGFVAVDELRGTFAETGVDVFAAPMLEAGDDETRRVRELSGSGCAVAAGQVRTAGNGTAGAWALAVSFALGWRGRLRTNRRGGR